jgi:hypothetical protein
MDMMWINQHPDYIKEKWNKYIGFKPNKLELYPQDDETVSWLKKWNVSNKDWEELKEVVNFIRVVNTKALVVSGGNQNRRFKQWSPSNLIEEFERLIGDKQNISNIEKLGLHALIEQEIEYWIWQTDNKRDYNLNLLV